MLNFVLLFFFSAVLNKSWKFRQFSNGVAAMHMNIIESVDGVTTNKKQT